MNKEWTADDGRADAHRSAYIGGRKSLFLLALLFYALPALSATTWYVNPVTGGTRYTANNTAGQCNGQSSAAYVSGTNQPCPFNDARLLWNDPFAFNNASWVMAPFDTVVLECTPTNQCQVDGSANASASGDFCWGIGLNCASPDLPNNVTLEGVNAGSCSTTITAYNASLPIYQYPGGDVTKEAWLWAGAGAFYALQIHASTGVTLNCIHLSDHSACGATASPAPGGSSPSCTGTDWASYGIYMGTTPGSSGTMTDVTIEGFQSRGIIGPIGGTWTTTRLGIGFNGLAGWDFDGGTGAASTGSVVNTNLAVYYNGCSQETYPYTDSIPVSGLTCIGQSNGGYGDGVGSPVSPLNFSCTGCAFFNNVQDALDLGHTYSSTILVADSFFYANNGGNIKVGPDQTVTVYNNLIVSGCNRMSAAITGAPANYNGNLGDFCRAFTAGGINIQANSTWLWDGANTNTAVVSCTGTACTSSNATTGLTVGQTIIPMSGTLAADSRTVASITDSSHWTISAAYTTTPTNSPMVVVAATPASTSIIHVYYNTIVGYANDIWDDQVQIAENRGGQSQSTALDPALGAGYVWDFRDNIVAGYSNPGWNSGITPTMWPELGPSLEDYNLCYNLHAAQCTGAHDLTASPLLNMQPVSPMTAEANLDNFDFHITSGSPARGAGVAITGITADYSGVTRPSPPSIGAFEFGSTPSTRSTSFSGGITGRVAAIDLNRAWGLASLVGTRQ